MNLHVLDYLIVVVLMLIVVGVALYTRRLNRSVADFLSANRCAGRYLLTVASSAAGLGAISVIAFWEMYYQAGFAALHWQQMFLPISLVLALSGWIIYRFRQTRSMTLAEFLEKRYSRRFRIFTGCLCWLSGILNYGIFPAVTARFFIYFLGLPVYTWADPFLGVELNLTLAAVMAVLLAVAVFITLNGGQIAVMVSDWVQGQFMGLTFIVLIAVLLWLFPWSHIVETLERVPSGQSLLNPFDQGALPDFNPVWFFIMAFLAVYNHMVWQGSQGYNSAAKSPHEAKMAGVIGFFRGLVQAMIIPLAAVCAYVFLHSPVHEAEARAVQQTLAGIGNEQLAKQMTTTVALAHFLPIGFMGLLAAVMVMAAVTTDSTYLHSWGSIFVQDVAMPIRQVRGKPLWTPAQHLRNLQRSVVGVAIFAWLFSLLFPLQEYITMYFQVTGAIFTGGAGSILIGGLYWRRGTVSGAWAAMITGSALAVSGAIFINTWPTLVPWLQQKLTEVEWVQSLPRQFWLNGVQAAFVASLSSIAMYVVVSLLTPDPQINFDKLFHRGIYAQNSLPEETNDEVQFNRDLPTWQRALGITREFTRGDKLIFAAKYALIAFLFGSFIILTVANRAFGLMTDNQSWANWWLVMLALYVLIGSAATVWFLIGGVIDLRQLLVTLSTIERDASDDGTVREHLGHPSEDLNLIAEKGK